MVVRGDNRQKVIERQCCRIVIFQRTNFGTHEFQCVPILVHANTRLTGEDSFPANELKIDTTYIQWRKRTYLYTQIDI